VNLWTHPDSALNPVDNPVFSPFAAHSAIPLQQPEPGVIPVLHTLYDYDKGIS
jgi:hypothetical protein